MQLGLTLAVVVVLLFTAGAWMIGFIDGRIDKRMGDGRPAAATIAATLDVGAHPGAPLISPDGNRAYVVTDVGISAIDTRSNAVGAVPLPVRSSGGAAAAIALSPDGTRLYASTTAPDGTAEVIAVIDTTTLATISYLPAGPLRSAVRSLQVSPNGATVYASVVPAARPERSTLKVIDVGTRLATSEFGLGDGAIAFHALPPGTRGHAANGTSVAGVDLRTGTVGPPLAFGANPFATAYSRDRATAYTTVDGGVAVIDASRDALVRTIPVTPTPKGIALAPDQRTLWLTGPSGISRVDVDSGAVSVALPHAFGSGHPEIAVTPDGRRAYVTDGPAGAVLVVDLPG